jgi:hypothetical protein
VRDILFQDWTWGPILTMGYYVFAGVVVASLFLVPPRFGRGAGNAPAIAQNA